MSENKYEGLPKVRYSDPQRRLVLRALELRETGDADFNDHVVLRRHRLDTSKPLSDYLAVWSVEMGKDLTHLATQRPVPVEQPKPRKKAPQPQPQPIIGERREGDTA